MSSIWIKSVLQLSWCFWC